MVSIALCWDISIQANKDVSIADRIPVAWVKQSISSIEKYDCPKLDLHQHPDSWLS